MSARFIFCAILVLALSAAAGAGKLIEALGFVVFAIVVILIWSDPLPRHRRY